MTGVQTCALPIWSVTGGATIAPAGLNATVSYPSSLLTTQTIRVNANNACGASQPGVLAVAVNFGCRTAEQDVVNAGVALSAFPNPTSGQATINFNAEKKGKYSITVTDLLGKAIMTQIVAASEGFNSTDINLTEVVKGVYLVSLRAEDGSAQTIRLVVE